MDFFFFFFFFFLKKAHQQAGTAPSIYMDSASGALTFSSFFFLVVMGAYDPDHLTACGLPRKSSAAKPLSTSSRSQFPCSSPVMSNLSVSYYSRVSFC